MSATALRLDAVATRSSMVEVPLRPAVVPGSTAACYRRRRAMASALAVLLVAVAGWGIGAARDGFSPVAAGAVGSGPAPGPDGAAVGRPQSPSPETYVVQPGDTLWSIARSIGAGRHTAELVQRISDANGGADLAVGQRLVIP